MASSSLYTFFITTILTILTMISYDQTPKVNASYFKYKDPNQPIRARVKDLVSRMTLAEKIGQMSQIDRSKATRDVIKKYLIGSVLSVYDSVPGLHPGGSAPNRISSLRWVKTINKIQKAALSTRLGIPMLYGSDAVHSHNYAYKAIIFPHNIGLGVTRFIKDPQLVRRIGAATAVETRATGVQYVFAPTIAVCRDPTWGRCYESYGEDPNIVRAMTDIIPGLQGHPLPTPQGHNVVACAKHYVGDGGTIRGIHENDTIISWNELMHIHMVPYVSAIDKGVASIMLSYSSYNGKRMHANRDLVTRFLKKKLKFRGFVISDFFGIDKLTDPIGANYTYSVEAGIRAGIDMVMIPYNYSSFILDLTSLVHKGIIPMSRIDDAVSRILRVKFTIGLFENPLSDFSLRREIGRHEHRELAREAVRKSLVLLKNGKSSGDKPMLPLPKNGCRSLAMPGSHSLAMPGSHSLAREALAYHHYSSHS
ncbi:Beta-glucosidase BoGH3B [Linum perenne]